MEEKIKSLILSIKSNQEIQTYDEAKVKQFIILQFLQILGWDIFNKMEVIPEHSIANRRVDLALRVDDREIIFIEVKKPSEDLEDHQEQLLEYAFRQGVDLAILTNGITWWYYLPTKSGDWDSRRFYTIDLMEQDINTSTSKFIELLSKHNVTEGKALKVADSILAGKIKRTKIQSTIPEAWNRIVVEPDSLIVEYLAEVTEKICGHKPTHTEIEKFIIANKNQLLVSKENDIEPKSIKQKNKFIPQKPIKTVRKLNTPSGEMVISLNGEKFGGISLPDLYLNVLKYLVDSGSIKKVGTPWGTGHSRYFLFKGSNPTHPSQREFFAPVSYKNYHLEAHASRRTGVKNLTGFCEHLGYKCKVVRF